MKGLLIGVLGVLFLIWTELIDIKKNTKNDHS